MGFVRRAELLLLALLAAPLPVAAQSGRTIYCCTDANSRTECGDVLPAACYGRAYREISPQGTVRRHVAAPLTREEIARRDAEDQRRKAEEERMRKQRRLDEALLESYASLEDIDVRQDRALADVERDMQDARIREAELRAEKRRLQEEAAAYREGEVPRELAGRLRVLDAELASNREVVDAKAREIDAIRERFAKDRRRYAELIAEGRHRR